MRDVIAKLAQAKLELDKARLMLVGEGGFIRDWETHTELSWIALQITRTIARLESQREEAQ